MNKNYQAIIAAPSGALAVCTEHDVLTGIRFLPAQTALLEPADEFSARVCTALTRYLDDPTSLFNLPLRAAGTPFQQRVWQELQAIPPGQTRTYTELAQSVASGARAVANACGANPIPLIIPCHRVVGKRDLGGFMRGRDAGSLHLKQWLLNHERR